MVVGKKKELMKIHYRMWQCEKCFENTKKYCIMGNGDINADIVITGMTPSKHRVPGEHERSRKTFGHKSWDVFQLFLEKTGIDSYFGMNVATCIKPHEAVGSMRKCREWYFRRLFVIEPRIVILMGRKTGRVIKQEEVEVPEIFKHRGFTFLTSYHPMSCVYDKSFKNRFVQVAKEIKKKIENVRNSKNVKRLSDYD